MAADLRRFLDGKPIKARRTGSWDRVVKWARRRPAAAALAGVSLLAVLTLLAGSLWYGTRLKAALESESRYRQIAEQAQRELSVALARERTQTRLAAQGAGEAGQVQARISAALEREESYKGAARSSLSEARLQRRIAMLIAALERESQQRRIAERAIVAVERELRHARELALAQATEPRYEWNPGSR
jgi:hypothetical protein